jgi:hypothetical protein
MRAGVRNGFWHGSPLRIENAGAGMKAFGEQRFTMTPVPTPAVPPDLALADDASILGNGEREAVQLQLAAAQAAAALEDALPGETSGETTGATDPYPDAAVDQEDLAPPATHADSAADRLEDHDGARPVTVVPFQTMTDAPSSGYEQEEGPRQPSPSGANILEADESRANGVAFTAPDDVASIRIGSAAAAEIAQPRVTPLAQGPRTLTQAIDTAAKLAADANAAAEALDNLKRLLRQGLPPPTHQPPRALPGVRYPQQLASAPSLLPKPPPVPAAASTRRLPVAPLPAPPPTAEPMRIDVRGFLAGFALSWAIGVVLYLFMTAG